MKMKISVIMLCSLLLMTTVGIVMAGNSEYGIIEYSNVADAVIDGQWTTDDEWTDGLLVEISDNANFSYNMNFTSYSCQYCIEIFDDDTDDEGDYWQICLDPDNSGGTTPGDGDFRIEIAGHTTLICYRGNGQYWEAFTPDAGEITWANTISASPLDSTPHWILEVAFDDKTTGQIQTPQPPNGLRVAVYDESNSQAGVQAWAPDSEQNEPETWGVIADFSTTPIPEGLSFAVMVFLSSIALVVGSIYLQKRSKREK